MEEQHHAQPAYDPGRQEDPACVGEHHHHLGALGTEVGGGGLRRGE
jgi:hypothetical protein